MNASSSFQPKEQPAKQQSRFIGNFRPLLRFITAIITLLVSKRNKAENKSGISSPAILNQTIRVKRKRMNSRIEFRYRTTFFI
jgi:hypothetical protein